MPKTTEKTAPTRAQKQEATRKRLLEAAAQQVGIHGYAGASIQKITHLADIANGTFYNYFDSQQDLFDQLLPSLGEDLLGSIRKAIRGEKGSIQREELGFRAFFDYLAKNPSFYRVLSEAETFAPKAYRSHMRNMVDGYMRALHHASDKGELTSFSERELEIIAYILLSARNYLSYHFFVQYGKFGRLPDWVTRAYMKFVIGGISYGAHDAAHSKLEDSGTGPLQHYTVQASGDGWANAAMHVLDQHLDSVGCIDRGVISGLIDKAATDALGLDADSPPQVTSLSTTFMRTSHARTVVAKAVRTAVTGTIAYATVTVHEHDETGDPIANGLVVFSMDHPLSVG